jgi:hypothetical protein
MAESKNMVFLIIGIVVLVGIVGIGAYFIYFKGPNKNTHNFLSNENRPRNGTNMNMQLNPSQIDDVTNFFKSNPSLEQTQTYCEQNRGNCFYYCRNLDQNNAYCTQMMNSTRTRGNFSRSRPPQDSVPAQ